MNRSPEESDLQSDSLGGDELSYTPSAEFGSEQSGVGIRFHPTNSVRSGLSSSHSVGTISVPSQGGYALPYHNPDGEVRSSDFSSSGGFSRSSSQRTTFSSLTRQTSYPPVCSGFLVEETRPIVP